MCSSLKEKWMSTVHPSCSMLSLFHYQLCAFNIIEESSQDSMVVICIIQEQMNPIVLPISSTQ